MKHNAVLILCGFDLGESGPGCLDVQEEDGLACLLRSIRMIAGVRCGIFVWLAGLITTRDQPFSCHKAATSLLYSPNISILLDLHACSVHRK